MGPRERLIEAGIRLLERDGPEALNARKLAAEIGASTMAVYTHFGGMAGLYEALTREAFLRFGRHLAQVPRTDNPVVDLLALGLTYRRFALDSPQRYRLMFGVTAPAAAVPIGHDVITEGTPTVLAEVNEAFAQLPEMVRRAMEAGRIREDDPITVAGQFWAMMHGYVLLEMNGVFGEGDRGVLNVLGPLVTNLLVGLGEEREAAELATIAVADYLGELPAAPPQPAPRQEVRRGRRPSTGPAAKPPKP